MEKSRTKVELDELLKGLGIISNVMLLGRLMPADCEEISSEQMVINFFQEPTDQLPIDSLLSP